MTSRAAPAFVGASSRACDARGVLADARAGRPSLTLVVGEPGIGKTRIVQALGRSAHTAGVHVLRATCFEDDPRPFAPSVHVADEIVARSEPGELADRLGAAAATASTVVTLDPLSGSGRHEVAGEIAPTDDDWYGMFVACDNFLGCDLTVGLTALDGVLYDVYLDENLVLEGAPAGHVDVFDVPFGSRLLEVRVHSTAVSSYVLSVDLD